LSAFTAGAGEFLQRDAAFGLQTDVDDGEILLDGDDGALDDGTFVQARSCRSSRRAARRNRRAPALAHDVGPAAAGPTPIFRQVETQYLFGFTTGADIGAEGEKEIDWTTDAALRKRAGRFQAYSSKVELEYVPTQFLQIALGARGTYHGVRNAPGFDDHNRAQFGGLSAEIKYLLVERTPNQPYALSLIVEPAWSRIGGAGGRETAFEIETKLAGDIELVANRLYAAANVVYEPEVVRDRGARAWGRESTLGFTGALTWRALPNVAIGGEMGLYRAYDSYFVQKYVGQALYVGPTMHVQTTKKTFVSLAWGTQIAGSAKGAPGHLDLDHFSRHRARLKVGVEF
jgi:hypothetical protein